MTLALCLALSGCGYSQADFDAAYNDGYRAGIIWCKRAGDPVVPALEVELLEHWQRGWRASTLAQCETEAQRVPLDALTPT